MHKCVCCVCVMKENKNIVCMMKENKETVCVMKQNKNIDKQNHASIDLHVI